jgi:hypothetical protein
MVIYAVCTGCPFLRAYSAAAADTDRLDTCPVCGAEMLLHDKPQRFPPTYVGRVSRALLGAPELRDEPRPGRPHQHA